MFTAREIQRLYRERHWRYASAMTGSYKRCVFYEGYAIKWTVPNNLVQFHSEQEHYDLYPRLGVAVLPTQFLANRFIVQPRATMLHELPEDQFDTVYRALHEITHSMLKRDMYVDTGSGGTSNWCWWRGQLYLHDFNGHQALHSDGSRRH